MIGTAKCTFRFPRLTASKGPPPMLLKGGVPVAGTCARDKDANANRIEARDIVSAAMRFIFAFLVLLKGK